MRGIKRLVIIALLLISIVANQTMVLANLYVIQKPGSAGQWTNQDVQVKPQCDDNDHSVRGSRAEYDTWSTISQEGSTFKSYNINMSEAYEETYKLGGIIPMWWTETKHRNITETASATIRIDKTKPEMRRILICEVDVTEQISNYSGNVTVAPIGEDIRPAGVNEISSIKGYQYSDGFTMPSVGDMSPDTDIEKYRIYNWKSIQGKLELKDEGVYELYFRAVDNAGNCSEPLHTTVIIDKALQNVEKIEDEYGKTISPQSSTGERIWKYTEPVKITASGTEVEGSKGFEYRINEGKWVAGSEIYVEGDGRYYIEFRGVSKFDGLYSKPEGVTVIIDIEGPSRADTINENWQNVDSYAVDFELTDELTTVTKTTYSINYSEPVEVKDGRVQLLVSEEGETSLAVRATDEMGNESDYEYKIKLDRTKPTITLSDDNGVPINTDAEPIRTSEALTIKAKAWDSLSGIRGIVHSINGGEWISGASVKGVGIS